jgi:hypothetical protein
MGTFFTFGLEKCACTDVKKCLFSGNILHIWDCNTCA